MQVLGYIERFRSGGSFLITLSVLLLLWFIANGAWHFDHDNLTLNLLLSVEAAYAMPVLLMAASNRAAEESERLKQVLDATHTLLRTLDRMAHTQAEIAEDVEEIEEKLT